MNIAISIVIIILMSMFVFWLDKKTYVGVLSPLFKQTIFGFLFAIPAIFATEFGGLELNGALVNVRDAPIIIAGLVFGPWAGIISAIWAAFDRFFITTFLFSSGIYTQVACTIATLFAGCFSALFHFVVFRKHRPYIIHAAVFALATELIHMLLIPLTHIDDIAEANIIMANIAFPIVLCNVLTVSLCIFALTILDIKFRNYHLRDVVKDPSIVFSKDLFYSFQFWLMIVIAIAFAFSIFCITIVYPMAAKNQAERTYIKQMNFFHDLIWWDKEYFPHYSIAKIACVYSNEWSDFDSVFYVVLDDNKNIVSNTVNDPNLVDFIENNHSDTLYEYYFNGNKYFVMWQNFPEYTFVMYSAEKHEMYIPYFAVIVNICIQMLIFALVLYAVFILLKKLIVNKLYSINYSLNEISLGHLEEHVNVYSHKEFEDLSNSINLTVDTLKKFIEDEANRYNEEFELARQIQFSSIPNVFPPFPNTHEIDFYAKYKPAKDIGGDLYDYYFVDKNRIAFFIADVSGKGIPAAMFMMRAKTYFRVFSEKHDTPAEILESVNNYLLENNEADMFVTAWIGIINLQNGFVEYASAGHNQPILLTDNENRCRFLESKAGLVLAALHDMSYKNYSIQLKPGDKLVLYTDGIIEAHDINNKLYGEDAFLDLLINNKDFSIKDICEIATQSVDDFSKGQEQFDDYSLVCMAYYGERNDLYSETKTWDGEIILASETNEVSKAIELCRKICTEGAVPDSIVKTFSVCIDEIFSNIVKYCYDRPDEYITIGVLVDKSGDRNFVKLTFVDTGPKFNPLKQKEPDITLSAEEREIGGLGIFMVRQMTDEIYYEYKGSANWLTLVKYFD